MIRSGVSEAPSSTAHVHDWAIVIPVKRAEFGKTRLRIAGVDRVELARAIALDTIEAVVSCTRVGQVIVVTSDEVTASALHGLRRVRIVDDPGRGLSAAIEAGVTVARADRPRGALLGDLPALRPDELTRALTFASSYPRAFVPDAEGTGTVLATARPQIELRTRFGVDSAAAHRAAGFVEIDVPVLSGLRRDLDVAAHLAAAQRAGLGSRTAALVGRPQVLAS